MFDHWQPDPAPTLAEFEAIVQESFETIPDFLREHCEHVLIRVEDYPTAEVSREMELETPFDLLGLYQGVSLNNQSVVYPQPEPEMVFLYRMPIIRYWVETGEDLKSIIHNVLIHEIGHHFGFSDDDMDHLETDM